MFYLVIEEGTWGWESSKYETLEDARRDFAPCEDFPCYVFRFHDGEMTSIPSMEAFPPPVVEAEAIETAQATVGWTHVNVGGLPIQVPVGTTEQQLREALFG